VNVGFVLYWQPGDAARMATRLAGRLHATGHEVAVYSRDRPQPVDAFWDRYVNGPPQRYAAWLRKQRPAYVVFGAPPTPPELGPEAALMVRRRVGPRRAEHSGLPASAQTRRNSRLR
jgi:hypothetical protein